MNALAKGVLGLVLALPAIGWAGDNSSFRVGEGKAKGGKLTVPLIIDQADTAKIAFFGFAARPNSLETKHPERKPHVELGELEIAAGVHTKSVKVDLARLKQKLGVGPGDTLHIAAHWVDAGHVWGNSSGNPAKYDGTTLTVPGAAAKNARFGRTCGRAWTKKVWRPYALGLRKGAPVRWPPRAPRRR